MHFRFYAPIFVLRKNPPELDTLAKQYFLTPLSTAQVVQFLAMSEGFLIFRIMANLKKLFDHLQNEHGLILVDSEMQEIERIVLGTHQPFVFTDWLDELVEQNKVPRIWAVEYKNKIGEDKLTVWVHEFDIPLFQDCAIPTTREKAVNLFQSFNLL